MYHELCLLVLQAKFNERTTGTNKTWKTKEEEEEEEEEEGGRERERERERERYDVAEEEKK